MNRQHISDQLTAIGNLVLDMRRALESSLPDEVLLSSLESPCEALVKAAKAIQMAHIVETNDALRARFAAHEQHEKDVADGTWKPWPSDDGSCPDFHHREHHDRETKLASKNERLKRKVKELHELVVYASGATSSLGWCDFCATTRGHEPDCPAAPLGFELED